MANVKNLPYAPVRFCIAGIICLFAAYLSEKTLGAVATIPFILILPGIASLFYPKPLHLTGLCALGAFIFKCIFASDIKDILIFMLITMLFGTVSAYFFTSVKEFVITKKKNIKSIISAVLFVLSVVIYINLHGTFFGNLSSEKVNTKYLENTYPDEQFLISSTYYSPTDRCYVTEFGFTSKERYSALVSTGNSKDSSDVAQIDGYRDNAEYEILERGKSGITTALSTFAYEGSDYVIRNKSLETNDILTAASSYSEYMDKTNYEIALYYQFDTAEAFENMCRDYAEHLAKYESVNYNSITFYGFDGSDKKDFSYTLTCKYGASEFSAKEFDSSSYSRYFDEKDTHKYWELLG